MIEAVATKSVLVKREIKDGKMVDVKTKRGEKIKLNEEDAVRIFSALDFSEKQVKELTKQAKTNGWKRRV